MLPLAGPRNLQVLNVELGEMRAAALTQTNTEMATAQRQMNTAGDEVEKKSGFNSPILPLQHFPPTNGVRVNGI